MAVMILFTLHFTLFISRVAAQHVEYWFDQDPGLGKATKVAATVDAEGNVQFEPSVAGLSAGQHLIGVRSYHVTDTATYYGPTLLQEFIISLPEEDTYVSRVEYFWDDNDPGFGQGTAIAITPGEEVNLQNVELSTAGLMHGRHVLHVRSYGCYGWGPTISQEVMVDSDILLVHFVEYFWDEDPGFGKGTPLPIVASEELNLENVEFSTDGLAVGLHRLFVRARGDNGWGPVACLETYVPLRPQDAPVLAAEYFWNEDPGYGLATPIEMTPGQEVSLENLDIPMGDIHGDALFGIRYRTAMGWSPTVTQLVLLDAEGNYTLNADATTSLEARNYQSLADVVTDFSDRGVGNDITLTLPTSSTDYALDATTDEVIAQLAAIKASLDKISTERSVKTITFTSENDDNALNITTTDEGMATVVNLFAQTKLQNVALYINGVAYDFTAVADSRAGQIICSGDESEALDLSAISEALTVTFTPQPHADITIVGYQANDVYTGTLPAMELLNSDTATDSLAYLVELKDGMGNTLIYYTYYMNVRPLVGGQTFSGMQPAEGSSLDPVATTLRWNAIGGAKGYRLEITDNGTAIDGSPVETTATNYVFTVETGHSYTWKVTAVGPCDEKESATMHFTGRLLPDLMVTSISLPEAAEAGNTLTVTAIIENQGEGATTESNWTDRLYYVIDSEDFAQAVTAASVKHTDNVAANGSYTVTFTMKVPQVEEGTLRVFVVTDVEGKVMEASDDNNRLLCATTATLQPFYVNASELAVLRSLYNELGGDSWNGTKWDITSELIRPGNWSGVTFNNDGQVTAIDLKNRGLAGQLSTDCALALPKLTSLDLSSNALTGDPAAFLADVPLLTTVNLSYNQLDALSGPLPANITSLNMIYQFRTTTGGYPGIDNLERQILNIGSGMTVTLPAYVWYNHSAQDFSARPELVIWTTPGGLRQGSLKWERTTDTYRFEHYLHTLTLDQDGEVIIGPRSGVGDNAAFPARMHFVRGDANLSGWVDVNDVQLTLRYILNDYSNIGVWAANSFTEEESSTTINIQDIVCTVNIVLDDESVASSRRRSNRASTAEDEDEEPVATFYADNHKVMVETTGEIGAFDLELQGVDASRVKLLLNSRQWQMQTRNTPTGVRLVVFSPTGETLPSGTTSLLRLGGDAMPVAVQATSPDAEELRAAVTNGTSTGILDNPEILETSESPVYDLQGRKVSSDRQLRKGIYITNGKKIKK